MNDVDDSRDAMFLLKSNAEWFRMLTINVCELLGRERGMRVMRDFVNSQLAEAQSMMARGATTRAEMEGKRNGRH